VRQHIRNALKQGATKEELLEVFELISGLGVLTCTVGMPILEEELKKAAGI
jgi:alkylhydroperoxidase/carboxymuconolactone decarboxylase family protein YurZ